MSDSLIYFGEAVKALDDNGRIGGYLIRFSNPADGAAVHRDLDGDYFTKDSYLGARDGDGVDTMFHHGRPIQVKGNISSTVKSQIEAFADHIFAPVKTKRDAIGIWAETVLSLADEFEKAVFGMVKANKIGWSSGAVSHLVKRTSDGELKRWPVGEASLTPCPSEVLNRAIEIKSLDNVKFAQLFETKSDNTPDDDEESAKSITERHTAFTARINQHIDDLVDDGRSREQIIERMAREAWTDVDGVKSILNGTVRPTDVKLKAFARVLDVPFESLKDMAGRDPSLTVKALFEEAIADKQFSTWQLWDIYAKVVRKLAIIAESSQSTGVAFDLKSKLADVNDEYIKRLNDVVLTQIADYIENPNDENFYLKSLTNPAGNLLADVVIDLDEHSQLVESALKGVTRRFRQMHEIRIKAGRILSEKNRTRIKNLMKQMETVMTDMQKLLDESKPMASDAEKMAEQSKHLRLQHRSKQLGVAK